MFDFFYYNYNFLEYHDNLHYNKRRRLIMNFKERVGQNIEHYRKLSGQTLKQVADKVGLTEATMQKYEKGQIKRVDVELCQKIADALETTPDNITGWLNNADKESKHKERIEQRSNKFDASFDGLSFEQQKLVNTFIRQIKQGMVVMPLSVKESDFINKYRLIDDNSKEIINASLETAYKVYLSSEKRENTVS